MAKVTNQEFHIHPAYSEKIRKVGRQYKIPIRVTAGGDRYDGAKNQPDGPIRWLGLAIVWMEIPQTFSVMKFARKHRRSPKSIDFARAAVIVRKKRRINGRIRSESIRYQRRRPTRLNFKPTMKKHGYVEVAKIESVLGPQKHSILDDRVEKMALKMLAQRFEEERLQTMPRIGGKPAWGA